MGSHWKFLIIKTMPKSKNKQQINILTQVQGLEVMAQLIDV